MCSCYLKINQSEDKNEERESERGTREKTTRASDTNDTFYYEVASGPVDAWPACDYGWIKIYSLPVSKEAGFALNYIHWQRRYKKKMYKSIGEVYACMYQSSVVCGCSVSSLHPWTVFTLSAHEEEMAMSAQSIHPTWPVAQHPLTFSCVPIGPLVVRDHLLPSNNFSSSSISHYSFLSAFSLSGNAASFLFTWIEIRNYFKYT